MGKYSKTRLIKGSVYSSGWIGDGVKLQYYQ